MNDYIYMLYRIKHHDSGMYCQEPFYAPIDTMFFFNYVTALRKLLRIRKELNNKGYSMKYIKSHIYPERVKTSNSYTYMCTYLVHPFPYSGKWYEYIILKCPIYEQECQIDAL